MLFGVCKGKTYEEAHTILSAIQDLVDGIELRLDMFEEVDLEQIQELLSQWTKKTIFTFKGKEQEENWKKLCQLNPDFIDLDYDASQNLYEFIRKQYPNIQIICSYHNFEKTPDSLEEVFCHMKQQPADIYKIATYARSSLDALKMLLWVKETSNQKVIGLCMGEEGRITRILSPVVGNFLNYASFEKETTALGQLSMEELFSTYHYQNLRRDTKVFAVIGYPVERSLGPITHNAVMEKFSRNAVYTKIPIQKEELSLFFYYISKLHIFGGLSVTMPLKEEIPSYLDEIDPEAKKIGAVNTIVYEEERAIGYNTDGEGAIQALEEKISLAHRKVIVIGAGGAAKAIIYAAMQRGAHVHVLNRTVEKALNLAKDFGCTGGPLSELASLCKRGYDVLINATPVEMPIPECDILAGCIAMDIKTQPPLTPFLKKAQEKGCKIIYGYEMFMYQATIQHKLWFKKTDSGSLITKIIAESTLTQLEI